MAVRLPLPFLRAVPLPWRGRHRHVSAIGGRAHLEVRGIHRPEAGRLRDKVSAALLSQPGVRTVQVLSVLGRVAVVFDEDAMSVDDLVSVVEHVEDDEDVASEAFSADRPENPGDTERLQQDLIALGADAGALALTGLGRAARIARLPTELTGLVSFVQGQPRVRHTLESLIGRGPADVALSVSNATAQALAQGPLGLVTDAAQRWSMMLETRARLASWREHEPVLVDGRPAPEAHEMPVRPAPLPDGPIEHYERQALAAAPVALAAGGLVTRNLRRASAALLVTTPKAATYGRDAFAAYLGRTLAARGVMCMDREALRRLDRVDAVVIDAPALPRAAPDIERVVPLAGFDPGDVAARARALFRPNRPRTVRRAGATGLEPLAPGDTRRAVRRARRELGDRDDLLLLSVDGAPAALVIVGRRVPEEAAVLVAAAHGAGHMVAVAGDEQTCQRLGGDLRIDGGDRLVGSIRMLQRDGCVPLLVSRRSKALAAADVGVGMVGSGQQVPWGADLLVPHWEPVRFLIEASAVAHEVSRQSAAVALAGAGVGALSLLGGPPARSGSRALAAVNTAAMVAMANGTRAALAAARRPALRLRPVVPWHELTVADAIARTGSRPEGLTTAEADERTRPGGAEPSGPSFLQALVDELANPLTPVLAGASLLAASVGSFTDAALVAGATGANALIGTIQRLQVENAVRALELGQRQRVRVRRDGDIVRKTAVDLVVGDVVLLDAGSLVPADCRILRARALEVDESSLTGESLPVAKDTDPVVAAHLADRASMLYAGSAVAAGTAEALVVAVGSDTEAAAAAVVEAVSAGGVEARLRDLTRVSIPVSIVGGAGVTVAGLLRGLSPVAAAQTGVALAVAAVPEGLPALATVSQLSAARRLGRRGALVRNARAIEALGRVEILCTDKTGTMTEGRIELAQVSDGLRAVTVADAGPREAAVVAAATAASPRERPGRPLRHLTDRAVVDAAPAWGVDLTKRAQRHHDLPFEPGRGYHAVIEADGVGGDETVLYVKGAPERLVPRCTTWRHNGGTVEIQRRDRRRLAAHVDSLGTRGFRVLAVATRPATGTRDLADEGIRDLELLGFLALADPVRPTAIEAASALREAGVRIVMVTGDHPSTAEGIAQELGILEAGRVLIGADLDAMDDPTFDRVVEDVAVFARVTPAHKVRIVESYRRLGRVVAMAGDGANDAAAIRLADVGVALGQNATSAARSGADLIVPGERVEALIDAVVEGRAMWTSVRDAVALLLGGNLGEVGFTVVAAALTGRSPLTARQLLLVNMLTDTVPAIALALRPPKEATLQDLMREGPEASLGRSLERAIYLRGASTAAGATAAWIGAGLTGQRRRTPTVTLVGLVGSQLGQTVAMAGRDPRVVAASLATAGTLGLVIMTPGLSHLFGCRPLGPTGWAVGLGGAVLGTAVGLTPSLVEALRRPGTGAGARPPLAPAPVATR